MHETKIPDQNTLYETSKSNDAENKNKSPKKFIPEIFSLIQL